MASTRRQLNAAFLSALVGTLVLVGATIWLEGMDAANVRTTAAEEQRRKDILAKRADSIIAILRSYVNPTSSSFVNPALRGRITETVSSGPDSTQELAPNIRSQLNELDITSGGIGNYVAVVSEDTAVIYASTDLADLRRAMDPGASAVGVPDETVLSTMRALAHVSPEEGYVQMSVFGERMLLLARHRPEGVTGISHFLVGTDMPQHSSGFGASGGAIVIAATLVILISLIAGYAVSSRAMKPVEQMINEVEAITDGRSLHKRVAINNASLELTRLADTLNAMMERLEVSFTALRTFTADASHELNTPLAVLRADVERAMHSNTSADEQMIALEEALREIRRMSDLVDSLLTLARADEGRLDMLRDRVDVTALTQEVYETALLLAEDAGLTVKLTSLEQATVLGDRDRLRQLFMNLVSNAIKYTPKGGRVDISLSERLEGIAFSVRDTGIGISQTDLAHVFERFWRADTSRSRASGATGHGLGLPIGHWIAQAHGGTLTATSKLGRGSTFTVTLPREGGVISAVAAMPDDDDGNA